jgi:hypothetical protein
MIPHRFVTEYPQRCAQLLHDLEPRARKRDLLGSFALLVASAAFTIPFARMVEAEHPFGRPEHQLVRAIRGLKKRAFLNAPFWDGAEPGFFRYAKILANPEHAASWRNVAGVHPINSEEKKDANTVLWTIRNALAHGNIVYLDENGNDWPGNRLRYLAFLSKNEIDHRVEGYRVVIFDEESFLTFLKSWIAWVQTFPPETTLEFAEAAE